MRLFVTLLVIAAAVAVSACVLWVVVSPAPPQAPPVELVAARITEPIPAKTVPQELAPADPTVAAMDETQRQYLWDVEHHGNVLSEYGFKPWGQALASGDPVALIRLLADGFEGYVPREADAESVQRDLFQLRRLRIGGEGEKLDAQEFVQQLLQYRAAFDETPHVSLSLMELGPLERENLDSEWRGGCQIRLWSSSASGPREVLLVVQYLVQRPDEAAYAGGGWLRSCTIRQAQVAAATKPLFREVAAERGIKREFLTDQWEREVTEHGHPPGGGVYACDYNRDGRWDLLITEQGNFRLYEGEAGGRFRNVTLKTKLIEQHGQRPIVPTAFADLDGDGWEDLILGGFVYRNEEGRSFTDVTVRTGLRLSPAATGIAVADYDHDGRVDLYVCAHGIGQTDSWLEGESGLPGGNELWRNAGDWRFVNVTQYAQADAGRRSTFTTVWLDADDDGWSDLYVINEFGNGVMLWNQRNGRFRSQLLVDGPVEYGSMGLTSGDIDNDGRIDLYVPGMYSKAGNRVIGNMLADTYSPEVMAQLRSLITGSKLHRNLGAGQFQEVSRDLGVANVGWAYGAALADLDNDGWLDVHALAGFQSLDRSKPDG